MLEYLRKLWAVYNARRQGFIPSKKLIDTDGIKDKLDFSPVSILLMLVLVWVVSAVLLGLSHEKMLNLDQWQDGCAVPFSVRVRKSFSAVDHAATAAEKAAVQENTPFHFKVDVNRSNRIRHDISSFFDAIVQRAEAEAAQTQFKIREARIDTVALSLYRAKEIAAKLSNPTLRKAADDAVNGLLQHGVRGDTGEISALPRNAMVVIHSGDKSYHRMPDNSESAAHALADALELDKESQAGFLAAVPRFFEQGNLKIDDDATQQARALAAEKIKPVVRRYTSGSMLITAGEPLTRDLRERLKAYRATLSTGDGLTLFASQLAVSFALLLAVTFFLYTIYRQFFTSARNFTLGAFIIILTLFVNYAALQLFFRLYSSGVLSLKLQLICLIPISLAPALLSVFFGSRVAIFGGALVAGITAQMLPQIDLSRLVLHWLAISTLIALFLRDTNNYRSFFVRLFLGSFALTMIVNGDYAIEAMPLGKISESVICIGCTALACAMTALIVIFAFELIFNADTRMSLMVLCDFNHPLLERLKREANGTLLHSLNVSVLAEDAANAIRANSLRAKAGALFHDIGKLKMPGYFIENNPASRFEYEKLSPLRSCAIIRNHVREGALLAKQYRLNHFIRRAIATHHGDDLVSFFYRRALEERGADAPSPVLEEQFRYDGPPPRGKEETIISLADACEAACRSINDPTPKKIEEMIENVIIGRLRGGQLRMSELSVAELKKVKDCFVKDLCDLVHRRISYSKEEKKDDPAALRVEVPEPSGAPEK